MKTKGVIAVLGTVVVVLLVLAFIAGEYHPPLLSQTRNPKEAILDFCGFGGHYSRYLWLAHGRDWPQANRQRLLAFWNRPHWSGFSDLREKSLFELGCWYERFSLPGPASLLFLEACRRNPGNRWLIRQSADKLFQMKQWGTMEKLRSLILAGNPEDRKLQAWLEDNFPAPVTGARSRDENGKRQ